MKQLNSEQKRGLVTIFLLATIWVEFLFYKQIIGFILPTFAPKLISAYNELGVAVAFLPLGLTYLVMEVHKIKKETKNKEQPRA